MVVRWVALVFALGTFLALPGPGAAATRAPGAPGETAVWTEADKDGYGTSTTLRSKVWHTLDDGVLTEVYFPDLGTPSVRDLQFIVSDGSLFAEQERDATEHAIELVDRRSLTYRQVNTARSGRYRITKTYVTDPRGAALLVDLRFESLTGEPHQLYVLYDPSLSNGGMDDSGRSSGRRLLASDAESATALRTSPALTRTSNGYLGTSDGWIDLRDDFRMDWTYGAAPDGNVVQTGRTPLTGLPGKQHLTLALGFGNSTKAAQRTAGTALAAGFRRVSARYAAGWHRYLASLKPAPRSAAAHRPTYDVSLMTLAAHEDKTFRGGFIASPSMPWVWGTGLENPSGAYHLVWSRDLYRSPLRSWQLATAPQPGARSPTCSSGSKSPTAASRRTQRSTARSTGRTSSSTRRPSRSCSLGSSVARTGGRTGSTSARRLSASWPMALPRPRSAGRTRAATRLPPSPRR